MKATKRVFVTLFFCPEMVLTLGGTTASQLIDLKFAKVNIKWAIYCKYEMFMQY